MVTIHRKNIDITNLRWIGSTLKAEFLKPHKKHILWSDNKPVLDVICIGKIYLYLLLEI